MLTIDRKLRSGFADEGILPLLFHFLYKLPCLPHALGLWKKNRMVGPARALLTHSLEELRLDLHGAELHLSSTPTSHSHKQSLTPQTPPPQEHELPHLITHTTRPSHPHRQLARTAPDGLSLLSH